MKILYDTVLSNKDYYITDPKKKRTFLFRIFLSSKLSFYPQVISCILVNGFKAYIRKFTDEDWVKASLWILRILENVGIKIDVRGLKNIKSFEGPAVFVGNHMSVLETFILPCLIQPIRPVTFVVKRSLLHVPVFKYVMRSRDPIAVSRINPREDFKTVMEEGVEKIQKGISIIIFPQSTRSVEFKPEEFNSLGVKLAARAKVPVVPIALKTDAWGMGKIIKDFGKIDIKKKVWIKFGKPIKIQGRGAEEHEKIIEFIQDSLSKWMAEEKKTIT